MMIIMPIALVTLLKKAPESNSGATSNISGAT